ncbi:MAG: tyrosine-type recombinase/integrase [Phycisphaerae bacterium]
MKRKRAKRMNFTKASIAALPAPVSGRTYAYDLKAPGLGVYVTPAGCKTFFRGGRINGRCERIKIGRFPGISVEQARTEAQKLTGQVAQGLNPQDRKRAAREEMTFCNLFALYMETHAKVHKKSWKQDQGQYDRYLKPLAGRKVSAITQADLERLHVRIGREHGHYSANRALALVRAVFARYAKTLTNPAKGIEWFPEDSRDRFLQPDELPAFFKALATEPVSAWRDFFWLLLLTGARRSNVQAMRWADLDLDRGEWRIPGEESKNGEPLPTVLSDLAVETLRRRQEENGTGEYVFPSTNKTGHVTEPKRAWKVLLDRAGLEGVRMHDLRRTLASWQARGGVSLGIIGRTLGHKSLAATQIYARLDLAPVRDAVEDATHAMLEAGHRAPLALLTAAEG